ncbi:MAG TPA: DUF4350 domain-containing protein [Flexivirga sp.]|uniref:DUF4350 domain-containing protein n=1 Tax=Flexivirga sp. TaxID=1962927 RepID=UPI002BFBB274|nr:DUF4350 domain-containing protein [Flexivirga sp.]HWC23395.1 DUF4350 domain-containing protein [Flexivirga sp.]
MITRGRVIITAVVVSLLALLIGAVLLTPRTSSEPLDPASAAPDGSRAVAQVLGQHGVDVQIAHRVREFDTSDVQGATLVLTRPQLLSPNTLQRTMALAANARRVVIVDADPSTIKALGLPVPQADPLESQPVSRCTVPWLDSLRLSYADISYRPSDAGRTCFGEGGEGAVVVLPAQGHAPETVLLGSHAVLSNKSVVDADNAAIILRTLGATDRLVWFAPSLATGDSDVAQGPKWPAWFHPAIWLAGAVILIVIVWRGRRFGRLVPEPLPVVVPAGETTRSRGQLYRKAHDHTRASAVLRLATRTRLARYLGLAPNGRPETLIERTARAAEHDPHQVAELLYGADPPDDEAMTALAQHLQQLERQVRR